MQHLYIEKSKFDVHIFILSIKLLLILIIRTYDNITSLMYIYIYSLFVILYYIN